MAVQDSENPSSSGARLSPGDAAFERLRQREALKSRDESAPTPEMDAAMFIGPPVNPATTAGTASRPSEHAHTVASGDRVLAMAAAFGIESATPAPAPVEEAWVAIEPPASRFEAAEAPDPVPAAAFAEVAPLEPPPADIRRRQPPPDATAERLEAALLDQLRSLEETLVEDAPRAPPRLPRVEPLRSVTRAPAVPAPDGPPQRSVFAPDPVRQRTYVDLRGPSPATEATVSDDPPWLKYLDEMPRPESTGRARPHRRAAAPGGGGRPVPAAAAVHDRKAEVEERGRGIRAMTAAAVLGLGVGLGLLVLVRPFFDSGAPAVASASGISAPLLAAQPAAESNPATTQASGTPVNQALATLLADPPVSRSSPGRPAVISEPGMAAEAPVVASSPEAAAPVALPAPPVIRPPPGEAVAVARAPDFDAAESGPLAYGPAIPRYDPVRQQLLDQEESRSPAAEPRPERAARAPVEDSPAPAAVPRGRAVINDFVNLRAKPDNAAPIVAILAEGLAVKVIACDYWCEIEAGGKRGFVFKKFVSR